MASAIPRHVCDRMEPRMVRGSRVLPALLVGLGVLVGCGEAEESLRDIDTHEPSTERPAYVRASPSEPAPLSTEPLLTADLVTAPLPDELAPRNLAIVAQLGPQAASGALGNLLDGSGSAPRTVPLGADGRLVFADLQPGTYQFWVTAPGLVSPLYTAEARSAGEADPIRITLTPASTLEGRVETHDGFGIAGRLTLVPEGHDHAPIELETGASGEFRATSVARGTWRLLAHSEHYAQTQQLQVEVSEASQYSRIRMVENATLRADVVDEAGRTIDGAHLRISPISVTASLATPKPFVGTRWVHPLTGKREMPRRHSRRFGASRPGARPSECGQGHCGVDLGGVRGAPVVASHAGTVVTASHDDRGASGRYVALETSDGLTSYYMHLDSIAEDLEVGMRVSPGHRLGALGRSGVRKSAPHLHFAVARDYDGGRFFVDPEPMLRFAVVLAQPTSSSNLPSHLPAVLGEGATPETAAWGASPRLAAAVSVGLRPDALHEVPPGLYAVTAQHPDFAPSEPKRVRLRAGQSLAGLRIVLPAGNRLSGQVLGPDGPVQDTWIRAYQGSGESRRRVARAGVDAEGHFTLPPLAGAVELEIGAAGFGILRREGSAKALSSSPQHFTLSRFDSVLRGQLRGANGAPLAGALIRIDKGPAGKGRRAITDAYGFYEFLSLPKGEYAVSMRASGYREAHTKVSTNSESETQLETGAVLMLDVRDHHSGDAIANTRLHLRGPEGQVTTALTGPKGTLRLDGLAPGTWRVQVDSPGYTRYTREVVATRDAQRALPEVLRLMRGARLAGVVRDEYGERVAGARVWIGESVAQSDSDGTFLLPQAPVGSVVLRARASRDDEPVRDGKLSLTLDPGDELVTLDIRLQPSAE